MSAYPTLCIDPGIRLAGRAFLTAEGRILLASLVKNPIKRSEASVVDDGSWDAMANELLCGAVNSREELSLPGFLRANGSPVWSRCVVEFPQKVYQGGKQKGDPEDLLRLAALVGCITAEVRRQWKEVLVVKPVEWKQQLSKEATIERILDRLDTEELAVVEVPEECKTEAGIEKAVKGWAHNVFDAVGIALWYAGRLKQKRVYAR
jgi:hypothetical protein